LTLTDDTSGGILAAAAKIGIRQRDIPPCVTFFAPIILDEKGRFLWNSAKKRAGDFVDLRVEMNLVLILSPHGRYGRAVHHP
jgi:hypothetical protein